MNKNILFTKKLLLLSFICVISTVVYPRNIADFFMAMPDQLLPSLSKQHRFELLEYSKLNRKDSLKNRFDNFVSGLYSDSVSQHIVLNTTKNHSLEMKLFITAQNDTLIGVINTIQKPFPLSVIRFYSPDWKTGSVEFLPPKSSAWLKPGSVEDANIDPEWIQKIMQSSYMSYAFSKTSASIEVSNHLTDFVNIGEKQKINSLLFDKVLVYKFDKDRFVLAEILHFI